METRVAKVDKNSLNILNEASVLLNSGALVAFPTETVYGLGANAFDAEACRSIFLAKGRPSDNPLIVHVEKPQDAEKIAYTCELYYKLAERFMPGPLTVILPKRDIIPPEVTAGLDTVAIRCPRNEVANALLKTSKIPIAAPSANASGRPSPTSAKHVFDDLNGKIPLILDGGECEFGVESTVVTLNDDKITILRPGSVTPNMLLEITGKVEIASAVKEELKAGETALSPGMKYKHYAPRANLYLIDDSSVDFIKFVKLRQNEENCAIMCYDEEISLLHNKNLLPVGKKQDIKKQTKKLFDLLRQADDISVDTVYAHLPSDDGESLAIYNRMIRACAHRVITSDADQNGGRNGKG